jgi:coenzyme Q-binding protein COQ10
MSIYTEKRFLPYAPQQLFELVAAVDRYPEFLPWCRAARIRSIEKLRSTPETTLVVADLVIGFGIIRERYRSRVMLQPSQRIEVTYVEGPFRCLNSHWTFDPVARSAERPGGGTMLTFHIEFEFRSKLLQSLMARFFDEAISRIVGAFKGRAKQLYGARRLRVPASCQHSRGHAAPTH